jgi:hemerythrin-like metal-binding protein
MALVQWDSEYSVGIPSIDLQHREMFDMINELYDAMRASNVAQVVPAILNRLEAHCREHFACEEGMMLKAGYPGYLRHKAEHISLTEKAKALARDFDEGKLVCSLAFLTLLKEWTQRHILSTDKKYSSHLQSAGLGSTTEESCHETWPDPLSPPTLSPTPAVFMGCSTVILRR